MTIKLDVKLKLDGKITETSIHGMYNDWTIRDSDNTTNLENIEYYKMIMNIVNTVEHNGENFSGF